MTELKLNCTLYFDVPEGISPKEYVRELMNFFTAEEMLRKANGIGGDVDWEYSDEESGSFNWVPL